MSLKTAAEYLRSKAIKFTINTNFTLKITEEFQIMARYFFSVCSISKLLKIYNSLLMALTLMATLLRHKSTTWQEQPPCRYHLYVTEAPLIFGYCRKLRKAIVCHSINTYKCTLLAVNYWVQWYDTDRKWPHTRMHIVLHFTKLRQRHRRSFKEGL